MPSASQRVRDFDALERRFAVGLKAERAPAPRFQKEVGPTPHDDRALRKGTVKTIRVQIVVEALVASRELTERGSSPLMWQTRRPTFSRSEAAH
jgi:hypothetical protein